MLQPWRKTVAIAVGCLLVALAGCQRADQIEHYTVARQAETDEAAAPKPEEQVGPDRMLAAMLIHQQSAWFFKLVGPKEAVGQQLETFQQFLQTVNFDDQGQPTWTLPTGWEQKPGNEARFATIQLGPQGSLQLTVNALEAPEENQAGYVLSNVNRWRGQMKLRPVPAKQLAVYTDHVDTQAGSATMVNLVGTMSAAGMGGPFSGAGNGK